MSTAQKVLDEFQGTGTVEMRGGAKQETINTNGKYKGIYMNEGKAIETSKFKIHYDSKGTAHVVPAAPGI